MYKQICKEPSKKTKIMLIRRKLPWFTSIQGRAMKDSVFSLCNNSYLTLHISGTKIGPWKQKRYAYILFTVYCLQDLTYSLSRKEPLFVKERGTPCWGKTMLFQRKEYLFAQQRHMSLLNEDIYHCATRIYVFTRQGHISSLDEGICLRETGIISATCKLYRNMYRDNTWQSPKNVVPLRPQFIFLDVLTRWM